MKNILVCVDFLEGDKILIEKSSELVKPFGSKIWLIHIAAPDPDFVGYEVGPQYIRDSRAEELRKEHKQLIEYANHLKENGIDAEGLLIQGATVDMIIKESKKLNIDLIIAGHHNHNFLYNALVGSASAKILRNSKIPILIIPFGEELNGSVLKPSR